MVRTTGDGTITITARKYDGAAHLTWPARRFCCVVLGYAMWPSTRTAFQRHQRDIRTGE